MPSLVLETLELLGSSKAYYKAYAKGYYRMNYQAYSKGWLSKLWSPLWYGTYYLGYPKRDPNFDNHPKVYYNGSVRDLSESWGSELRGV